MNLITSNCRDISILLTKIKDVYNPIILKRLYSSIGSAGPKNTKSVYTYGPTYRFGSKRIHIKCRCEYGSIGKRDKSSQVAMNVLYEDVQKEIDKLDCTKYENLNICGIIFE